MLGRELHHVGRQVPAFHGRAVDDRLGADLRERLVQARVLGELLGLEAQDAGGVGVGEVGDEGLGDGLGDLVAVADDHQAEVRAERHGLQRADERVALLDRRAGELVEVEVGRLGRHAGAKPLDGGIALELVATDDEVCRQQRRFRTHGDPFERIYASDCSDSPRWHRTRTPATAGSSVTSPTSLVHKNRLPDPSSTSTHSLVGCP